MDTFSLPEGFSGHVPVFAILVLVLLFHNCSPFPGVVFFVLSWLRSVSVSTFRPFLVSLVPSGKSFHSIVFCYPFYHFLVGLFLRTSRKFVEFVRQPSFCKKVSRQKSHFLLLFHKFRD